MQNLPMHSTVGVHLRMGIATEARAHRSGSGTVRVGSWENDNFEVTFFGDADMFRHLAEEFYKAAEALERANGRQRALDNAPRRRFKWVAEAQRSRQEEVEEAA